MRGFSPVVLVSTGAMNDSRKDLSMRCPITAQLVGDQLPGWSFLMLQHLAKEAPSGSTIATFGNQNIDYVSILIHSSPQIEVLTSDFDEELIYMPDVAESPLLPPQIASIGRPELQTPISNCLVRNDAASLSKQPGVFQCFLSTPSSHCSYMLSGCLLSLATPWPSPLDG